MDLVELFHPTYIKKALPIMEKNRTNGLSKHKEVFHKSKPLYNQILKDSGFKQSLNFELKTKVVPRKRYRKRKISY